MDFSFKPDMEEPINQQLCDEVKTLLTNVYLQKSNSTFEECYKTLQEIDLKACFLDSLKRGFAGFEIFNSPYLLNITREQKEKLHLLSIEKTKQAGLTKIACISLRNYSFQITPTAYMFEDVNRHNYYNFAVVTDDLLFRNNQTILSNKDKLVELEQKLEALWYSPGNPGYLSAKKSFES